MRVLSIEKILNLKKWQPIQDNLSRVTKLAIITADYKGVPVTQHSLCSAFCTKVRNDPKLRLLCQKCDSRAGLEAVRSNEPYIYLCHFGIVDVAIPFSIYGNYVGTLMIGQVRLPDGNKYELEQILARTICSESLSQDYEQLPVMTYEEIKLIANTLFYICNYLIEEALDKDFLIDIIKKQSKVHVSSIDTDDYNSFKVDNIKHLKDEMQDIISNAYISDTKDKMATSINPLILPAIDYIFNNKFAMPTMKDMSKLCRLSPSYFSKLFSSEYGQSYTQFISNLKITWARDLLENTDQSITQISDNLGFADDGYFIKKFKKVEGMTPFVYRKYYKSRSE